MLKKIKKTSTIISQILVCDFFKLQCLETTYPIQKKYITGKQADISIFPAPLFLMESKKSHVFLPALDQKNAKT